MNGKHRLQGWRSNQLLFDTFDLIDEKFRNNYALNALKIYVCVCSA